MASVYVIEGPGGKKRKRRRARATSSGASCRLGDHRRVNAGKGYTQELACTGKGPTGWSFVKGTRRRGR
jgi:hypothetical protein